MSSVLRPMKLWPKAPRQMTRPVSASANELILRVMIASQARRTRVNPSGLQSPPPTSIARANESGTAGLVAVACDDVLFMGMVPPQWRPDAKCPHADATSGEVTSGAVWGRAALQQGRNSAQEVLQPVAISAAEIH